MQKEKINPLDILSGKVVQNEHGTFYFKEAGYNVDKYGAPIWKNLNINHADLLSGKVVQNERGAFWFKAPGNNTHNDGFPTHKYLHNLNGPACIWQGGTMTWWVNGDRHRIDGPAWVGHNEYRWFLFDKEYSETDFNKAIKCLQK